VLACVLFTECDHREGITRDKEVLSSSMRIMQCYVLLGGDQFMNMYCPAIVTALERTIGQVADNAALPAIDLLDLCIQVCCC